MQLSVWTGILCSCILTMSCAASAQNRSTDDRIFDQPADGFLKQIFLGSIETSAALRIGDISTPQGFALQSARADLKLARILPTSETERRAVVNSIFAKSDNYEAGEIDFKPSSLTLEARKRRDLLEFMSLVTTEEKTSAILQAQASEANAQLAVRLASQKRGLIKNSFRILRLAGGIVLAIDAAGRLFIWNGLKADPTISPGATYLQHILNR